MQSSVSAYGHTLLKDEFDEDIAELQYLNSKPTCFIIIGKPGCGRSHLANRLAETWKCRLLQGTKVIQDEIRRNSAIGNEMNEILMKGQALPTAFVVELLRGKLLSPEVRHYGYVLDDLPTLSDESSLVQEYLEMIKGTQLKPDFIINIKIPDADLEARLVGMRADSLTGDIYLESVWNKEIKPAVQEEDLEQEELEDVEIDVEEIIPEPIQFDKEVKERLVHLPEHQLHGVNEAILLYKDVSLPLLEEYMSDHDRQYVIELDGNYPANIVFEELMLKLETYTAQHAIVPVPLYNSEEEDAPEDVDVDDLFRALSSNQMPGPRYRWRRSQWGRWCPVALKNGNMVKGKPEFAVTFLDKVYVLSSSEALTEFLKNPRPFLLPPMPAIPCKLVVFGPPLSGKTSIAKYLANKYKATIFNVKEMMASQYQEEREKLVEKVKKDAMEHAMNVVQNKLEQEFYLKISSSEVISETLEDNENNDDVDNEGLLQHKPMPPVVTESNEEVCHMVDDAVKEALSQDIKLPPEVYIEELKKAFDEMLETRKVLHPDETLNGGWIIDGFPETREHWLAMTDAGIVPDDYIALQDKSAELRIIMQRYCNIHKEEITQQYRTRLISENQVLVKEVEDEMQRLLEAAQREQEFAERKKSIESSGEHTEDENREEEEEEEEGQSEKLQQEDENEEEEEDEDERKKEEKAALQRAQLYMLKHQEESEKHAKLLAEINTIKKSVLSLPSFDAPEFVVMRDKCRVYEKEFANIHNAIIRVGGKVSFYAAENISVEDIGKNIVNELDGAFGYQASEMSALDLDEEEEDVSAELEAGEEEGEEDEEAMQFKRKHFGFTKHFDPVALKEKFVLWPGNPDYAAKYREKIYYFLSAENRQEFIKNPLDYLPKVKPLTPPPLRLLLLGSRGSGKTLQGKVLAKKHGIFHISFLERLQELILPKLKRRVGSKYDEYNLLKKEQSVSVEEAVRRIVEPSAEEENEEEAEEPKVDMNEEEDAIYSYLVDNESLSQEMLSQVLSPLWNEEPYKSTGFILEGFPNTTEETQLLLELGFFPDAAMALNVDENDVINRLLPSQVQFWKERKKLQHLKKIRIHEKQLEIRREKMNARRNELIEEQNQRKLDGIEEEEEEEDIEEILQAEFEEEEEDADDDEEEETEEDAINRLKSEITDNYDGDVTDLQAVHEALEEGQIPFLEVSAKGKPHLVEGRINRTLIPFTNLRHSAFERVYPVSDELAQKLLLTGYKHPSVFTKWDPVKLYEGDVMAPMRGENVPTYPVVYQHCVYFLSSLETRKKFMADPMLYTFTNLHAKPVVPIQIAVIGPPKCGKTSMCNRFTSEYGSVRVSVGGCVRKLIESQPHTRLIKQIQEHLYRGEVLPDELAVEAIAVVLMEAACTTRGYTIDGYPSTSQQMALLNNRGILPAKIIELQIEAQEMLHRNELSEDSRSVWKLPLHNSDDILAVKYSCYCQHTSPLQVYYQKHHQNWMVVDGKMSKWKMWNAGLHITLDSVEKIQEYLTLISKGQAAPINGLCITPREFEKHLGVYGHYCPVSLNSFGELVDCSDKNYLQHAVEYRSKYYKISNSQLIDTFLDSPEQFVPPLAKTPLPPGHLLPIRRSRAEAKSLFPMRVEFEGYCPVTYGEGDCRYDALVEGDSDLVVEYRDALYLFADEEKLMKFMRTPEIYCELKLPKKLPPKKMPMNLGSLPMLGYLEQHTAHSLVRALTDVGCLKPKYPFSTIKKSALFFVACHLKAFNPKYTTFIRDKYLKKLRDFEEVCEILPYLGNKMPKQYKFRRSIEFDVKLNRFVNSRSVPPSRDWVK